MNWNFPEHLENLIDLARGIKSIGVENMDFSAFDTQKIDAYAAQAKAAWGTTPEYHEYEEKARDRTAEQSDCNLLWKIELCFEEILCTLHIVRTLR